MKNSSPTKRMNQFAIAQKVPLEAFIVVTERCHLRCQQCYLVENPREEMTTEEIIDILDQLAASGTFFVIFTGGEPLLRPDIYDLLSHAKSKGMMTSIFTTATSCNPARVQKLVEAGLSRASISVYAADPAIHDEVTQIPGSFHKTMAGVRELRRAGVMVKLKFLQMSTNVGQLSATRALAEDVGAAFNIDFGITVCHDGRREPLHLQVQEELLLQLHLRLAQEDPEGVGKIKPKPPLMDKPMCGAGHSRVVVGTDGEVYPCLDLNIPIGNIRQQPLQTIWQSREVQEIRKLKRFSDPICRVCPDQQFCSFCPGRSLLDTGDPSSPNATTCMTARVRHKVYKAQQTGQVDALVQPTLTAVTATSLSSSCQQCSGGLQQKVEDLLKQPSLFPAPQNPPKTAPLESTGAS